MLIGEMHIALDQELDSINVRLEDNNVSKGYEKAVMPSSVF